MRFIISLFTAAILLTGAGAAQAENYILDKAHTHVGFAVNHLGFSMVHGQFRDVDAVIDFDPAAPQNAKITFTIQAASLDTGWEARDTHLRGADFFNTESHPTITFISTHIEMISDDTARVAGDLTMVGKTREVAFKARLNKIGPSPFAPDTTIAGFTVTGKIDRTKFGMGFGVPAIGAVIPVEVNFEMSPG